MNKKKFDNIKNNLLNINALFESMKQREESMMIEKNKMLVTFEKKCEIRLNQEIENRKILEDKLSTLIEDKYNELKLLISQEGKTRYDELERIKSILERDLPSVAAFPKYEIEARKNNDEKTKEEINKAVEEYKDKIVNEKKIREGNEEAFIESLKIAFSKFKLEIGGERKTRKENEDKLISLLEIACNHINNNHEV